MIIVLHGFGSNGTDSSTCNLIEQAFPDEVVLRPTYTSEDPHKAHKELRKFLADHITLGDELLFVGISLGGFWARHFANEWPGSKLVMLNPSIMPAYHLQKRIGENMSYATGEKFTLTEVAVYDFKTFTGLKDRPDLDVYLVLAKDDTEVPINIAYDKYLGRADITITAGGHRLKGQEDLIEGVVLRALNTFRN